MAVMVEVRDEERVPEPQRVLLGVPLRVALWEAVRERLSVPVPQGELVVLGVMEGEAVGVGLPEGHREEEGDDFEEGESAVLMEGVREPVVQGE